MEFQSFGKDYKQFQNAGTEIVGVSTDDVDAQKGFCGKTGYPGIMLSDKDLKISDMYGVLIKDNKISKRAYFIVDKKGVVRYINESFMPLRDKTLLSELAKIK